ncbi:MAG: cation transporter [Actinomycetota bacterium]
MSTNTTQLQSTGMTCPSCSMLIEMTLKREKGVIDAISDYATQKTDVTYDPAETDIPTIIEKVNGAGYETTEVK